jgi:hypothetical protein
MDATHPISFATLMQAERQQEHALCHKPNASQKMQCKRPRQSHADSWSGKHSMIQNVLTTRTSEPRLAEGKNSCAGAASLVQRTLQGEALSDVLLRRQEENVNRKAVAKAQTEQVEQTDRERAFSKLAFTVLRNQRASLRVDAVGQTISNTCANSLDGYVCRGAPYLGDLMQWSNVDDRELAKSTIRELGGQFFPMAEAVHKWEGAWGASDLKTLSAVIESADVGWHPRLPRMEGDDLPNVGQMLRGLVLARARAILETIDRQAAERTRIEEERMRARNNAIAHAIDRPVACPAHFKWLAEVAPTVTAAMAEYLDWRYNGRLGPQSGVGKIQRVARGYHYHLLTEEHTTEAFVHVNAVTDEVV